jgi:hypothetical protein
MNETMISDSTSTALRDNAEVAEVLGRSYAAGFVTDIEMTSLPPGLSEDGRRGGRCGVRFGFGRHHLPQGAGRRPA